MPRLSLFGDGLPGTPSTEGIKYAGSKLKLLPHILRLANSVGARTVLDGFSGTTRVSQAFAKSGYTVVCNDIAVWSEAFGTAYLLNEKDPDAYRPLIDHLNALPARDGWFTEHYGGHPNGGSATQSDGLKKPWQIHNTRKLDGIREEIEVLRLDKVERAVALTSLMLALDRVDNSLGHFASYLRKWSPRSYRTMSLDVPRILRSERRHRVHREDILDCCRKFPVDLAYFDPPYGSNNEKMPPSRVRYAAYYHLWKSVCLFDKPELFGKVRRRRDTSDRLAASVFEEFRRKPDGGALAVAAIDGLLRTTEARWIVLSYSSGGRATAWELSEVLERNGKLREVVAMDHAKSVMAGMKWTNEWVRESEIPHREFLFLLEK